MIGSPDPYILRNPLLAREKRKENPDFLFSSILRPIVRIGKDSQKKDEKEHGKYGLEDLKNISIILASHKICLLNSRF